MKIFKIDLVVYVNIEDSEYNAETCEAIAEQMRDGAHEALVAYGDAFEVDLEEHSGPKVSR